jgi:hypothetical protein
VKNNEHRNLKIMKSTIKAAQAIAARESLHNTLRRIENASFEAAPTTADLNIHERVTEFNAALATEAYFQQPLTDFAVGWRDADLDAELEFFAPEVPVSERFEYAVADNAEEFLSDGDDDERAIKGDFKDVEYTETKVQEKTRNRGLQITLDLDLLKGRSNWEEYYVQKLLRRIKRNSLRRAITLLNTGTNDAKTWDATAGKDPDQDVLTALIAAADQSGVKPNRVGYGDTELQAPARPPCPEQRRRIRQRRDERSATRRDARCGASALLEEPLHLQRHRQDPDGLQPRPPVQRRQRHGHRGRLQHQALRLERIA